MTQSEKQEAGNKLFKLGQSKAIQGLRLAAQIMPEQPECCIESLKFDLDLHGHPAKNSRLILLRNWFVYSSFQLFIENHRQSFDMVWNAAIDFIKFPRIADAYKSLKIRQPSGIYDIDLESFRHEAKDLRSSVSELLPAIMPLPVQRNNDVEWIYPEQLWDLLKQGDVSLKLVEQ